jgi:hypothetical protein
LDRSETVIGFRYFLQRCGIEREGLFAFRYDLRLFRQESGCGFLPPGLCFSDGSLVSVEDGKRRRKPECKEAVSFLIRVARSDLKVWVLFGYFKLQVGFGCRVLRESATNVQAIQDSVPLDLWGRERFCTRRGVQISPRELDSLNRSHWNSNGSRQRRLGLENLTFGGSDC